jgi:hypothetical protein
MAYIMEGVSLFGVTPCLKAIPAGGFVISASHIAGETFPVASSPVARRVFMSEEVHAQGLVESESVVDLGVIPEASSNVDSTVDHGAQVEGANASAADMLVGSEHLENIGEFELLTSFLFFCNCVLYYIYIYIYIYFFF